MILFALLGLPQGDAAAVAQRFERYMTQAKSLSVVENITYNGVAGGKGTLKIARPGNMVFTIAGSGIDFRFALNAGGGLETDRVEKIYDLYPSRGKLFVPPSRMSAALSIGIPRFILDGNLNSVGGSEAKYTVTPKQTMNGVSTDLLQASVLSQAGNMQVKVWVDSVGRIVRFWRKISSMEGTTTLAYDFSNYVVNPKFPTDTFSTKIPLGYSPIALDQGGMSIEPGAKLPAGNYVASDSGRTVSLKSLIDGKNALVLVMDPEFPANGDLLRAANDLSRKVPDSRLVVIGFRRDVGSAKRLGVSSALYDPKGTELAKLQLPGAPTLYLLDKKGAVIQTFFGFDGKFDGVDEALKRVKG